MFHLSPVLVYMGTFVFPLQVLMHPQDQETRRFRIEDRDGSAAWTLTHSLARVPASQSVAQLS